MQTANRIKTAKYRKVTWGRHGRKVSEIFKIGIKMK
jgi:hypothetical protein